MSNLLAAVGRGRLRVLPERVARKRAILPSGTQMSDGDVGRVVEAVLATPRRAAGARVAAAAPAAAAGADDEPAASA